MGKRGPKKKPAEQSRRYRRVMVGLNKREADSLEAFKIDGENDAAALRRAAFEEDEEQGDG